MKVPPTVALAFVVGTACGVRASAAAAQSAPRAPAFDVASIKRSQPSGGTMLVGMRFQPGARFSASNVTLRNLIMAAYNRSPESLPNYSQFLGGPGWLDSDLFNVAAEGGEQVPTEDNDNRTRLMLRALLAERFHLVVHGEAREMPIYHLVVARSDGKTGPGLHASPIDCTKPQSSGREPIPSQTAGGTKCGFTGGPASMVSGGMPISLLATALSNRVGRVVIDRTGLTGPFDLKLEWAPDDTARVSATSGPAAGEGASLFTALQEQLGLKLEPARGPVDVLVVDRAEQPTQD